MDFENNPEHGQGAAPSGTCEAPGSACGLCGATMLTVLSHGSPLAGTVICHACGAHWWQRWYTSAQWELWINEPNNSMGGCRTPR